MKTYYVNVHFDMVVPVEVEAASESEAIEKAYQIAENAMPSEMECVGTDACITD